MENDMSVDNSTTQENDKYVYVKPDGGEIWCYGSIEFDSNFQLCCDDEDFDGVVADCEGDIYNTWDKVCQYLMENYRSDIEEITAV
tara:strand:+ start:120 stop:377 length:258 start_codon:yes stop_codon:yes gene_type:complete